MSEERKIKTAFAPTREFDEVRQAGWIDPATGSSLPALRQKNEAAFSLRGGFTSPPALDTHCLSRAFYNVPMDEAPAPEPEQRERTKQYVIIPPDAIVQCAVVARRVEQTLEARIVLNANEQVLGPEVSNLIVRVLPSSLVRADGVVTVSVKGDHAYVGLHLQADKLQNLVAAITRDVCPSLAISFDFSISGSDVVKTGGNVSGGNLNLPNRTSVKGRAGNVTTACPRTIRSRLNVIQKAGGL